jgi:hypothetical protein
MFHAQAASGVWSGGRSHGAVSQALLSALMVAAQARHVARQSTRMAQAYSFGGHDPIKTMKGLAALLMQRPPKKKKRERGRDENGLPLWWLFRQSLHEEEEIENEGPAPQLVKWWLLEPHDWTEPEPG